MTSDLTVVLEECGAMIHMTVMKWTTLPHTIFILTSQMKSMNPALTRKMDNCLVPGQTYRIINAKRMPTKKGMRLYVVLRIFLEDRFQDVLFKLPGGFSYLFSYPQIDRINSKKLHITFSYFGKSLSGEPIIQIRNEILPAPTFEEMEAAGALNY